MNVLFSSIAPSELHSLAKRENIKAKPKKEMDQNNLIFDQRTVYPGYYLHRLQYSKDDSKARLPNSLHSFHKFDQTSSFHMYLHTQLQDTERFTSTFSGSKACILLRQTYSSSLCAGSIWHISTWLILFHQVQFPPLMEMRVKFFCCSIPIHTWALVLNICILLDSMRNDLILTCSCFEILHW